MKTIIVGLGNPILGDDGVGWRVAQEVQSQIANYKSEIEVDCLSLGGLSLMERLIGYDYAILVDALAIQAPPGSVRTFSLDELPDHVSHATSAHDTSLKNALRLGRCMGAHLPGRVAVVGIAARPVFDFGEELSPPLNAAVGEAARAVLELLREAA